MSPIKNIDIFQRVPEQPVLIEHTGDAVHIGPLTDFWLHMGSRCNLHCHSCFEDSHTYAQRLESPSFNEAEYHIFEALEYGAQRLCFTGGEPFINPDFIKILGAALNYRPCLVLTNATAPIELYLTELASFALRLHPLHIRVSIDYPLESAHDRVRGQGSFKRSLQNCARLARLGHHISIARRLTPHENPDEVSEQYRNIFQRFHLADNTPIIASPEIPLGVIAEHTQDTAPISKKQADSLMCTHSMMAAKRHGKSAIYPCPFVHDNDDFILGRSLAEAREITNIRLNHARCTSCLSHKKTST